MTRFILVLGVLWYSHYALGQPSIPNLTLPDSVTAIDPQWVDLNNDGQLDILILMKTNTGKDYVQTIPNDTTSGQLPTSFPIISYDGFVIVDYDRDNDMDILVSGDKNGASTTVVFRNDGDFNFEETATTLPHFTIARFGDFDNDATPEIILSGSDGGESYTRILKELSPNSWIAAHDSLKLQCSSIEVLDADGDGDDDIFVSGLLQGSPMTSLFQNHGDYFFTREHEVPLAGHLSAGDLNGDGFFEVILMGEDQNGTPRTKKYQRTSGNYVVQDLPVALKNGRSFIADFDHDGNADIFYAGVDGASTEVNRIQYSNGSSLELQSGSHRFGDREHDGNLEYLYFAPSNGNIVLKIAPDLSQIKNSGPRPPKNALMLSVFDRVFLYWDEFSDDHTPAGAITYDVFLHGESNYQTGEFDLLNEKRLTVSHGNNGTKNYKLFKSIESPELQFAIQGIDNSFHPGGMCIGGSNVPGPCANVDTEEIFACTHEKVVFEAPASAMWFSFASGFLGTGSEMSFTSDGSLSDTLFYFNPGAEGTCASLKAWSIRTTNDTSKTEELKKFVCSGSNVELNVEPGWENVEWTSENRGNLGSASSVQVNVTAGDVITVRLSNADGCEIIRKTELAISSPEVKLADDHYKIMSGSEVQLSATGAQRYSWTPSTGLSQNDIPNPVASPLITTQYTVVGYDSVDCQGQATVTVTVESTSFIPNLFSPNDDGKNDHLKIYGLTSAERFTFSIYDRDGALVYKTSSVSEAVQTGWDGTKNGSKQPPGVYFWKVQGDVGSGRLLLNGKDSGSIVLIR